jgi:hypothetical protein
MVAGDFLRPAEVKAQFAIVIAQRHIHLMAYRRGTGSWNPGFL